MRMTHITNQGVPRSFGRPLRSILDFGAITAVYANAAVTLHVRLLDHRQIVAALKAQLAQQLRLREKLAAQILRQDPSFQHQTQRSRSDEMPDGRKLVTEPIERIALKDDRTHQHEAVGE